MPAKKKPDRNVLNLTGNWQEALMKKAKKKKPGRKPLVVSISGDWEAAVEKALKKPKPPQGWPRAPKK
jgi:hypothetical protein